VPESQDAATAHEPPRIPDGLSLELDTRNRRGSGAPILRACAWSSGFSLPAREAVDER